VRTGLEGLESEPIKAREFGLGKGRGGYNSYWPRHDLG